MECPRCDSPLERYALDGREAVVCADCGYVGVPIEHRGEHRRSESWNDAIRRFRRRNRPDDEELTPAFVPIEDGE